MKVVLFCGGLGTRIREYSENIPKPMIPVGHQPILWHVMQYYSEYGHTRFHPVPRLQGQRHQGVLPELPAAGLRRLRRLGLRRQRRAARASREEDWRVTLIDTGIWRNIGERLWAVRDHVKDEEIFLANYSDGLTDVDLDDMVERFKQSGKLACFLAVRPPLTYHLADIDDDGRVREFRSSDRSDIWINAGYFLLRREIFDYMQRGRGAGARAVPAADRGRPADGLQARGLLARDGHAEGPAGRSRTWSRQGKMPWRVGDAAEQRGRTLSIAGL